MKKNTSTFRQRGSSINLLIIASMACIRKIVRRGFYLNDLILRQVVRAVQ